VGRLTLTIRLSYRVRYKYFLLLCEHVVQPFLSQKIPKSDDTQAENVLKPFTRKL